MVDSSEKDLLVSQFDVWCPDLVTRNLHLTYVAVLRFIPLEFGVMPSLKIKSAEITELIRLHISNNQTANIKLYMTDTGEIHQERQYITYITDINGIYQ